MDSDSYSESSNELPTIPVLSNNVEHVSPKGNTKVRGKKRIGKPRGRGKGKTLRGKRQSKVQHKSIDTPQLTPEIQSNSLEFTKTKTTSSEE